MEQILLSEHGAVTLHRLTNLLRFYASTIKQVVPAKAALISTLDDLDQMAYSQFISVLQATVQQQTNSMGPGSKDDVSASDLAPSPSTLALLSLLRDILSSTSVLDEQPEQLEEIITTVVDPLLQSLTNAAASFPTTGNCHFKMVQFH